jgi:hypothetical protein
MDSGFRRNDGEEKERSFGPASTTSDAMRYAGITMMDTGFRRYDGTIIDAADLDCIASKLRQAFGDRLYGCDCAPSL